MNESFKKNIFKDIFKPKNNQRSEDLAVEGDWDTTWALKSKG